MPATWIHFELIVISPFGIAAHCWIPTTTMAAAAAAAAKARATKYARIRNRLRNSLRLAGQNENDEVNGNILWREKYVPDS